eukprot:XP_001699945.1 predicted protein [Chlamydomonas reinhardtii]
MDFPTAEPGAGDFSFGDEAQYIFTDTELDSILNAVEDRFQPRSLETHDPSNSLSAAAAAQDAVASVPLGGALGGVPLQGAAPSISTAPPQAVPSSAITIPALTSISSPQGTPVPQHTPAAPGLPGVPPPPGIPTAPTLPMGFPQLMVQVLPAQAALAAHLQQQQQQSIAAALAPQLAAAVHAHAAPMAPLAAPPAQIPARVASPTYRHTGRAQGKWFWGGPASARTCPMASAEAAAGSRAPVSHSTVEKQRRDRINSLIDEHVVLADTINLLKALRQRVNRGASGVRNVRALGPACNGLPLWMPNQGRALQDDDDMGHPGGPGVTVKKGPDCFYVQVTCPDRKGLLSDITDTLRNLSLEVRTAAVTTNGGSVRDVFEVVPPDGAVALAPEAVQSMVQGALSQRVAEGQQEGAVVSFQHAAGAIFFLSLGLALGGSLWALPLAMVTALVLAYTFLFSEGGLESGIIDDCKAVHHTPGAVQAILQHAAGAMRHAPSAHHSGLGTGTYQSRRLDPSLQVAALAQQSQQLLAPAAGAGFGTSIAVSKPSVRVTVDANSLWAAALDAGVANADFNAFKGVLTAMGGGKGASLQALNSLSATLAGTAASTGSKRLPPKPISTTSAGGLATDVGAMTGGVSTNAAALVPAGELAKTGSSGVGAGRTAMVPPALGVVPRGTRNPPSSVTSSLLASGGSSGSSLKAPVGLSRCTIVEDAPFPPPNTQVVMELHEKTLRVGGRRLRYRGFRPADRPTVPVPGSTAGADTAMASGHGGGAPDQLATRQQPLPPSTPPNLDSPAGAAGVGTAEHMQPGRVSVSVKVPWAHPAALLQGSAGGAGAGDMLAPRGGPGCSGGGLLESLNAALASGSGYMVVGAAVRPGCAMLQLDLLLLGETAQLLVALDGGAYYVLSLANQLLNRVSAAAASAALRAGRLMPPVAVTPKLQLRVLPAAAVAVAPGAPLLLTLVVEVAAPAGVGLGARGAASGVAERDAACALLSELLALALVSQPQHEHLDDAEPLRKPHVPLRQRRVTDLDSGSACKVPPVPPQRSVSDSALGSTLDDSEEWDERHGRAHHQHHKMPEEEVQPARHAAGGDSHGVLPRGFYMVANLLGRSLPVRAQHVTPVAPAAPDTLAAAAVMLTVDGAASALEGCGCSLSRLSLELWHGNCQAAGSAQVVVRAAVLLPGSVDLWPELRASMAASLADPEQRGELGLMAANLLSYTVLRGLPATAAVVRRALRALGYGLEDADAMSAAAAGGTELYDDDDEVDAVTAGAVDGGCEEENQVGLPLVHLAALSGSMGVEETQAVAAAQQRQQRHSSRLEATAAAPVSWLESDSSWHEEEQAQMELAESSGAPDALAAVGAVVEDDVGRGPRLSSDFSSCGGAGARDQKCSRPARSASASPSSTTSGAAQENAEVTAPVGAAAGSASLSNHSAGAGNSYPCSPVTPPASSRKSISSLPAASLTAVSAAVASASGSTAAATCIQGHSAAGMPAPAPLPVTQKHPSADAARDSSALATTTTTSSSSTAFPSSNHGRAAPGRWRRHLLTCCLLGYPDADTEASYQRFITPYEAHLTSSWVPVMGFLFFVALCRQLRPGDGGDPAEGPASLLFAGPYVVMAACLALRPSLVLGSREGGSGGSGWRLRCWWLACWLSRLALKPLLRLGVLAVPPSMVQYSRSGVTLVTDTLLPGLCERMPLSLALPLRLLDALTHLVFVMQTGISTSLASGLLLALP